MPPQVLCKNHLLGEHRELHAIWVVIIKRKKGYSHHPETLRWVGKLKALFLRHVALVFEMTRRGYKHYSDLDQSFATGLPIQDIYVDSIENQKRILKTKNCRCTL